MSPSESWCRSAGPGWTSAAATSSVPLHHPAILKKARHAVRTSGSIPTAEKHTLSKERWQAVSSPNSAELHLPSSPRMCEPRIGWNGNGWRGTCAPAPIRGGRWEDRGVVGDVRWERPLSDPVSRISGLLSLFFSLPPGSEVPRKMTCIPCITTVIGCFKN